LNALVAVTSQKIVSAILTAWYGKKVELRTPPHEHADSRQLQYQFVPRPQIDDVVEQADQAHRERKSRQPRDSVIGQSRQPSHQPDSDYEACQHCNATEQGSRLFVGAVDRRSREDAEV